MKTYKSGFQDRIHDVRARPILSSGYIHYTQRYVSVDSIFSHFRLSLWICAVHGIRQAGRLALVYDPCVE